MAWLVGIVVVRDAPGTPGDFTEMLECNFSLALPDLLSCDTECDADGFRNASCSYASNSVETLESICDELTNQTSLSCQYGLLNNFQVRVVRTACTRTN